jgi:hypothetical protein
MDKDLKNGTNYFNNSSIVSLNQVQIVYHLTIILTGIPLNVIVAVVQLLNKRLHNTRNAIWCGVIFSNLLVFCVLVLEIVVWGLQSSLASKILLLLNDKADLILLVNLLLVTGDRFVYTKWQAFHKRHVIVARTVALQLICTSVTFLGSTVEVWVLNGLPSQVAPVILVSVCIASALAVGYEAKKSSDDERKETSGQNMQQMIDEENSEIKNYRVGRVRITVHFFSKRPCRMERIATQNVLFNLVPLCLFVLPLHCHSMAQILCPVSFRKFQWFNSLQFYLRELHFLYFTADLLVYMIRCPEFRIAAVNTLCRFTAHPRAKFSGSE